MRKKFLSNGYTERAEYRADGSLIYMAKDYKDAKGRIIRIESDDSVLSSIYHHTETITYASNGLISKIDFRQFSIRNGQRHPFQENGTYYDTYQYKYDKNGNWTDRILTQQYVGTRRYQWVHIEYFK